MPKYWDSAPFGDSTTLGHVDTVRCSMQNKQQDTDACADAEYSRHQTCLTSEVLLVARYVA